MSNLHSGASPLVGYELQGVATGAFLDDSSTPSAYAYIHVHTTVNTYGDTGK